MPPILPEATQVAYNELKQQNKTLEQSILTLKLT